MYELSQPVRHCTCIFIMSDHMDSALDVQTDILEFIETIPKLVHDNIKELEFHVRNFVRIISKQQQDIAALKGRLVEQKEVIDRMFEVRHRNNLSNSDVLKIPYP
ncbi:hypothetical protein AVEN_96148-1 [Araneus ventricosus]|uniref:Uncharacterized protein n=1 Tax=Araneus ventricosus TaxID=182803 RepID=A0A4Y2HS31_ARAVE|nr:hypothetical protein AVEN_96148-1 [Araneus ventricosus]